MSIHGSCDDCGAHWTGERIAHCTKCCLTFASDSAFDRHVGRNGCSDPARFRDTKGQLVFAPAFPRGSTDLVWKLRDPRPFSFSASGTNHSDDNTGQVAV